MIPASLRQYLDQHQVDYEILVHAPRATAQETAQSVHVTGKRFAKVVLLRARRDSGPPGHVIAVLPAHEKVDLVRLGAALGQSVELAGEEEFTQLFPDAELGAAPPFGDLAHVPVVADACLARRRSIVFNAGTHTDLIEMGWGDFVRVARPQIFDYGRQVG